LQGGRQPAGASEVLVVLHPELTAEELFVYEVKLLAPVVEDVELLALAGLEDDLPVPLADELKAMSINDFLEALPSLDDDMSRRAEDAKWDGNRIWYLGKGDLENEEYSIGFEDVLVGDPITRSRESDNVLTIHPRHWRRPVTVMGPGAGPQETVAGILSGLSSIHRLCHR